MFYRDGSDNFIKYFASLGISFNGRFVLLCSIRCHMWTKNAFLHNHNQKWKRDKTKWSLNSKRKGMWPYDRRYAGIYSLGAISGTSYNLRIILSLFVSRQSPGPTHKTMNRDKCIDMERQVVLPCKLLTYFYNITVTSKGQPSIQDHLVGLLSPQVV